MSSPVLHAVKGLVYPYAKKRHSLNSDNNYKNLGYHSLLSNTVGGNQFFLQNEKTLYTPLTTGQKLGLILHDTHFQACVILFLTNICFLPTLINCLYGVFKKKRYCSREYRTKGDSPRASQDTCIGKSLCREKGLVCLSHSRGKIQTVNSIWL